FAVTGSVIMLTFVRYLLTMISALRKIGWQRTRHSPKDESMRAGTSRPISIPRPVTSRITFPLAPFLGAVRGAVVVVNWLGARVPPDGYSRPYLITMAVTTALYGFVGLL